MTDTKQSEEKKSIKTRFLFFPLSVKVLVVLAVTILPLTIAALAAAGTFEIPRMPLSFLRTGEFTFGEFVVPVRYALIVCAIGLGLIFGISAADALFIRSADRWLKWIRALRREEFRLVPPVPRRSRDEIGEIGSQMALAAATFSRGAAESEGTIEQRSLFIMTAAHQLRTPLTALAWTVESLRNPTTAPEEREQLLGSTAEALARMRSVIEHILASANVEEGKFGYVFEQIDIVPIIEHLINESKPLAEKQQVSLSFTHENAFPVFADKERISLALSDLISNALEYTPQGGRVSVNVKPAGEKLEIAVTDTGIGISEPERKMLFTKLYRGDRARHMRPDGSGLGLFVVKNIIEQHGSDITVDSREGKGARMSFFLSSTQKPSAA